jgi:hypothetical protein
MKFYFFSSKDPSLSDLYPKFVSNINQVAEKFLSKSNPGFR